eukprot:Tamp_01867.p1 GENE.Tamp_01867~~Tamp_01867.p1  ORF type:complete len:1322 (+),score=37.69 Tamp_01867:148-4113(+)
MVAEIMIQIPLPAFGLQCCLILSFLLAIWAHRSEKVLSKLNRFVVRNLRFSFLLILGILSVSTVFLHNVLFIRRAALTVWDGPYEGLYLAGGNAGSEHDLLTTSQEACLKTDGCEGVTRTARPDGSGVWQLRTGRSLWLEKSPSGEVSYTWRHARKCSRRREQDGLNKPPPKISALYYISQAPMVNRRDSLLDVLHQRGMPSGLFQRWVPRWSSGWVRWGQDIINVELYTHLNVAQQILRQFNSGSLVSSNDWSLVLEDHVRPIVDWNDLLTRLRSTVCADQDVGLVYLGASRRFRLGNSSLVWSDFLGSDAYAVKNDLAHQLFRLSQGWKRQNVVKDQLTELWVKSLPAHGLVARHGGGVFVARAGLNLTAPRRRYPHAQIIDQNSQSVKIIWTGPYDAAFLSGGKPGQEFICLGQGKDACLAEHDCYGLTSVAKKTGEVTWQLRIGAKMWLEHSTTGEVSYLWKVRNASEQGLVHHDAPSYGSNYGLLRGDLVTKSSHLWHKPSNGRMQEKTEQGAHDNPFHGPVPAASSGAESTWHLQPTRQLQLASGYTFWQNMYLVNRSFIFVQGPHPLDMTAWAIMSESESLRRWGDPSRYASPQMRGFTSKIVEPNHMTEWNWTAPIAVEPAIMITDFIPKFTPHLYHMLENLVGIWATSRAFMVNASSHANEPTWLLLPQNTRSELAESTRELILLMFPGIRVLDQIDFRRCSPRQLFSFSKMVASDRSAADHGGVNQMITGISSRLPQFMPSMVSTVLRNAGLPLEQTASDAITITFVDRQGSHNRRLGREHSKNLLWLLGTTDPRIRVHWTRFELLSLREQIVKAADTDVLVGVHGNGLSHVLWIRKPGALVEILPGSGNRLLAYQQFCEIRGLLYYGIEASSGVVHREGSCASQQQGNRWYPPAGCSVEAATMNQISADLDVNHLVCLVYDALYTMQRLSTDPRRSCGWPSCAAYLGAPANAARGCVDGRVEYECTDLGPSVDASESGPMFVNGYCHGLSKSVAYCSPGMFLCTANANPGWRLFLKGLHTWGYICREPPCQQHAEGSWKGFLLDYGLPLAISDVDTRAHKLCVLLPYRDGCQRLNRALIGERAAHLKHFLAYMQDFLVSAGHADFEFVVAVQTDRGLFNKGALYNIGANVAARRGCDFVALHDIDHLPMDYRNRYSWPNQPLHLCTNSSDVGWERFAGGAVLMQLQHFALINGFSNLYNGWGAEDADLYDRVERIFGTFERLDPHIGYYVPMNHSTGAGKQITEDGESAHAVNLNILERQRNSVSRSFLDSDGYMQMRSHLQLVNISLIDNIMTVTVDVLKDGMTQVGCV